MTRAMIGGQAHQDAGSSPDRLVRSPSPDGSTLLPILRRLEEILHEESEALRHQSTEKLPQLFQRKGQSLLELVNAQRSLGMSAINEPTRSALKALKRNLQVNSELLKLHLDATTELIEVFSQAVREMESDGTYDLGYGRPRRK